MLIVSFFLPREVSVEHTLEIDAPTSVVFGKINDVKKWEQWFSWFEKDPDVFIRYRSRTSGLRAGFHWYSDNPELGRGTLMIMERDPYYYAKVEVLMHKRGAVDYIFDLEGIGPTARITMTFQTGFYDNPLHRYLGLMMDQLVKDELEISLLRLKNAAENRWKELQKERR